MYHSLIRPGSQGSGVGTGFPAAGLRSSVGVRAFGRDARRPYDPILMFKILVIQAQNGLSDDRAEFLINDWLSFMRFLDLGLSDRVPDPETIWMFHGA